MRTATRRALLNCSSGDVNTLHLTATTTGAAETVTINRITPAAGKSLTIAWGDGNSTVVAAGDTVAKSNAYAGAGTYAIRVSPASDIVQLDLHNAKLSGFRSGELASSALTYFICYSVGNAAANVVSSADMAGWTPTSWQLYSMPAGTYAIDSADMAGWTPTSWQLSSMPAGTYAIDSADMAGWTPASWWLSSMPVGTYAIDSADMAGWTPASWRLFSMPAGTYAIDSADMAGWTPANWWLYSVTGGGAAWTLAAANFAGWVTTTSFQIQDNALTQAQVNAVLYGMYQATLSRTVTGGTISVGGTNSAPSGVYQAAAACPVSAATPGKEVAHELLNDGCNAIAAGETWTTVTFTV